MKEETKKKAVKRADEAKKTDSEAVKPKRKKEEKPQEEQNDNIIYIVEEYSDPEDEEEVKVKKKRRPKREVEEEYDEVDDIDEIEEAPKRKRRKKHIFLKIILSLIFIWAVARGLLIFYFSGMNKQEYKKDYSLDRSYASDSQVSNILIVGTDSRNLEEDAGRSDCIMLLSVNRRTKKIEITSFLRDSYVNIPGHNPNRINAAYQFGGAPLLIQTIEENYKITIDNYIIIDFFSCMDIIDAVGGVTIDVTGDEANYINMYLCEINQIMGLEQGTGNLKEYGRVTLTGMQALAYSRIRYIGTDFARTDRQRTVLMALIEAAKKHPIDCLANLREVFPEVTTSLGSWKLSGYAMELPFWLMYEIEEQRIPADKTWSDLVTESGMDVLNIDFEANRRILWNKIYDKEYN